MMIGVATDCLPVTCECCVLVLFNTEYWILKILVRLAFLHQLEGMESWEQHARHAHLLFEKVWTKPIMIEELALYSYMFIAFKW